MCFIPAVNYAVHCLQQSVSSLADPIRKKCQELAANRLRECADTMGLYIPGRAALSRNGKGEEILPQVEEFLKSDARVMLIQGDSGSGKTCAAMHIERELLENGNAYIPHYVRLIHLVDQSLRVYLNETIGSEHKEQGKFLFLLDGYDEINCQINLITQEKLKEWKQSKFLFTCRTQHLKDGYRDNFKFVNNLNQPIHSSLMELYMSPFNDEEKKAYIRKVTNSRKEFNLEKFEEQLHAKPRLKEMASLPFVLAILTEVLPELKENSLRCEVYEKFARKRFLDEKKRLNLRNGVDNSFYDFSIDLAFEMLLQKHQVIELPLSSEYRNRMQTPNNNPDAQLMQSDDAIVSLARTGSMIRGLGNHRYEFLHPSLRDFFAAVKMLQHLEQVHREDMGKIYLSSESAVVDFLAELLWTKSDIERKYFIEKLFALIEASKDVMVHEEAVDDNDENLIDEAVVKASSNAATLLARAGIAFSGRDLRGVRLDKANLSGGIFHHTNLQEANLKGATMQRVQLVQSNLRETTLDEVEFGEMVTIKAANKVNCVAYHPTRNQCALGLNNTTTEVWDADQADRIITLQGHESWVTSVCYSTDGKRVLSGSWDNTVRQWKSTGGAATEIFLGHENGVLSVCYCPDGNHLLSGSADHTVRQWPSTGGAATEIFRGHEGSVTSVCYSPDGNHLLSGSADHTVRQWPSTGGVATAIFHGHEKAVTSVCYSPDGMSILSGSYDKTVRQWPSSGGAATMIFRGHEWEVMSVCYSPDGKCFSSGSADNSVRQWQSTGGAAIEIFRGHERAVTSVCYSPDGMRLLSGSFDKTVRQWTSNEGASTEFFRGHEDEVTSVCYSSDGTRILSGNWDNTMRQWLSTGGAATEIFRGHGAYCTSVCYSPDGKRLLSGSFDSTVRQWQSTGGAATAIFRGHGRVVTSVCYSPDGKRFLSGSWDTTVRQWQSTGGATTEVFCGHEGSVTCVCYNPDGNRILSGSADNTVRQWQSTGGVATEIFRGHEKAVTSVCYSPDGERLISGSYDNTIRQWKSTGGVATVAFLGHKAGIMGVCYSPDGKRLLSGSNDNTACIWDARGSDPHSSEKTVTVPLFTLRGHHLGINSVAWSVCNEIVTGSRDYTIAVWRQLTNSQDVQEIWGMVWRSGYTPIVAFGCQINEYTTLSTSNRALIKQRSEEER